MVVDWVASASVTPPDVTSHLSNSFPPGAGFAVIVTVSPAAYSVAPDVPPLTVTVYLLCAIGCVTVTTSDNTLYSNAVSFAHVALQQKVPAAGVTKLACVLPVTSPSNVVLLTAIFSLVSALIGQFSPSANA